MNVSVAGDSSAFLQLDPTPSDYAQENGGTLQIDLDGTNAGGSGINTNATTAIDPLFTAENQGDSGGIDLYIDTDDTNSTVNAGTAIENTVKDSSSNTLGTIEFIFKDSNDNVIVDNSTTNSVNLASQGATENISLEINVPDINPSNIASSSLLSSITVVAKDDGT
ncbi:MULTISPECIES: hypothetical protein [Halostella]|uniref:hypothetical protein n=1 Tax=Halostella TaxID=1843185 RepID=UPI00108118BB|nr:MULTISPECIES: hypothetical protein [Halostella]